VLNSHSLSIRRTQALFEGIQLPLPTLEQTLIDSVIYTEEIGRPQEKALTWFRSAFKTIPAIRFPISPNGEDVTSVKLL